MGVSTEEDAEVCSGNLKAELSASDSLKAER